MKRPQLRSRDLVGRAGVGAIVELGRQSFVVTDLVHWGGGTYGGEAVPHDRLAQRLGVTQLRSAHGAKEHGPALVRFPAWLFCDRCGALREYRASEFLDREPKCSECPGHLIGMRWVAACSDGHLFDVPWGDWAHLNRQKHQLSDPQCRRRRGYRVTSLSRGYASYGSIVVTCRDCGAASDLRSLPGKGTLGDVGMEKCPGRHPWYAPGRGDSCDQLPEVLMRASSRLHFPQSISMLEIPPEADRKPDPELRARASQVISGFQWSLFRAQREEGRRHPDLERYAELLGCLPEDLEELLDQDLGAGRAPGHALTGRLDHVDRAEAEQAALGNEWMALMSRRQDQPSWSRFLTEHAEPAELGSALASVVDRLVLVHRVREVRAFAGYRRMSTDRTRSKLVGPTKVKEDGQVALSWLPAHEVLGEGVFINIKPSVLRAWAADPKNRERSGGQLERRNATFLKDGRDAATTGHPWFVPLHTLAHLLIRDMAFIAGYSAASLRERIYVGTTPDGREASGILVYTAEGDSEGTLGGLVRIGEPARMRAVVDALQSHGQWCSQDPVCRESAGQGWFSLNLAACHGCCLLPETSCVHANILLDRNAVLDLGVGGSALLAG